MSGPNASADALLTEHFRYTPLALIDDIINTVNAIVYRALTAIESGLLTTPPSSLGFGPSHSQAKDESAQLQAAEKARSEIEDGVHQLETLLEATVDKNFDKFEIYLLRNLLSVPDGLEKWIKLAHYENLNLPLPLEAPTPESINVLRTNLQTSQDLSLALEAEQAANDKILSSIKSLTTSQEIKPDPSSSQSQQPPVEVPPLTFLASSSAASNPSSTPLTTSSQFSTSQLPALRTLLSELKPRLESLNNLIASENALAERIDWDAPREERKAYVEGEAVRAVKGEIGALEGSGGEKGELGRSREQAEVEGLEKIVARRGLKDQQH